MPEAHCPRAPNTREGPGTQLRTPDLGHRSALNLTQTPIVDVASDNDDELPTWNAASATGNAGRTSTWDAASAAWDAASRPWSSLKLSHAPGSAGTKISEVGSDAEEAIWREAQGWVCGHGKAGMWPCFVVLELTAHVCDRTCHLNTSAKSSRTTAT